MSDTVKRKYDSVVLGIDAGGTYFKSALVNIEGKILKDSYRQTPVSSYGTKAEIMMTYKKIIQAASEYTCADSIDICGIGISTPGPFDYIGGISLMRHKFQDIEGVNIRDEIYAMGIFQNDLPVIFMHDAHAFLIGEHWTGAIQGIDNAAAIILGTGLGFGVIKDSKIVDNGKGGPFISIFSRQYKERTLEDAVSRRGIISRYLALAGNNNSDIDVFDIAEAARKNDIYATKVFHETGEILAGELLEVFKHLAIEAVVFGGQISKSFDLFGPPFQDRSFDLGLKIQAIKGDDIEYSPIKGVARIVILNLEKRSYEEEKT